MSDERKEDSLAKLERTQAALRKNIEDSNELIARSEELLERHRAEQTQNDSEA